MLAESGPAVARRFAIETFAVTASWDPWREIMDIWASIQMPKYPDQTAMALKLPMSAIRVHYDVDVGGSYGVKRGIKHTVLVGYLAKRLGFPVRFVEDRMENMRGGDMHGPERLFDVEVAFDDTGVIRSMKMCALDNVGAYAGRSPFQLGKPVSAEPNWPMLYVMSTLLSGLLVLAMTMWRRRAEAKQIAIFAIFAQMTATAYVEAVWIDVSRAFYFERMVGVAFWAVLLGLFSYALLRGIADSLTRRMADPSLYGARVREAWRSWRELPRLRIFQRVDLMLQMLYLAITVLCIFYLVVLTIDWYDGVIRLSDTFYRQIAIDGRYRDFPIWSFVIPSVVLMTWKILTVLRKEPVSRRERLMRALSFGRLLGYDGTKGFVRMDRSLSHWRPVLPEIVLAGSFTKPVPAKAGDVFDADYGALGRLQFRFVGSGA